MPAYSIDTNVAIVANGRGDVQVSEACRLSCIRFLRRIQESELVLLDALGLIIAEYRKYMNFRGEPGVGDAFFVWLHDNQANATCCRKVEITQVGDDDFLEFPTDPRLDRFDRSDRKFAAVVKAYPGDARVANATDSDWYEYCDILLENDVQVFFLCADEIAKFISKLGQSI